MIELNKIAFFFFLEGFLLTLTFKNKKSMNTTIISCPGKVLIAGGYLVLNSNYQGFVIATPSRFYSIIQNIEQEDKEIIEKTTTTNENEFKILVNSPQFLNGNWEYLIKRIKNEKGEIEWEIKELNESK